MWQALRGIGSHLVDVILPQHCYHCGRPITSARAAKLLRQLLALDPSDHTALLSLLWGTIPVANRLDVQSRVSVWRLPRRTASIRSCPCRWPV